MPDQFSTIRSSSDFDVVDQRWQLLYSYGTCMARMRTECVCLHVDTNPVPLACLHGHPVAFDFPFPVLATPAVSRKM